MTVHLIDLEAVSTRYTGQWKTRVPSLLRSNGHDVNIISGPDDIPNATTPGAFLNFGGTNIYKAVQVEKIARLFTSGQVKENDHFIFTDAWHPGIINLKYMSELLNVPVTTHGLWHAGSYDPQDFLGRLIGAKGWVRHAEKSFFYAFDHNYFATDFHITMFDDCLLNDGFSVNPWREEDFQDYINDGKIVRTGWPMEYMEDELVLYKNIEKRNLILFPHRIAPEKQVDIFLSLRDALPQYKFVICQEQELTKNEYHNLLGEAKLIFSANLQETLGISCYEGALLDAIPMVPDRLSYSEMYFDDFKYPSKWTEDWNKHELYLPDLCHKIINYMEDYKKYLVQLNRQKEFLKNNFFTAQGLLENLKSN